MRFIRNVNKHITSLSVVVVILAVSALSVNAAAFTVNTTADTQDASGGNSICADSAGNCSLRAAITEANALAGADVISLPAGIYTETLVSASDNANLGGDFDITSDIQIIGSGSAATIVQANVAPGVATERVFHIRGISTTASLTVSISGVTIRNGRYAVFAFGAGVHVDQGTNHNVTFANNVFSDNQIIGLGGGLSVAETITPTININGCRFLNNFASSVSERTGGAGINIDSASVVNINDSFIQFNVVSSSSAGRSFGGGIGVTAESVTMTVNRSTISDNNNIYGGGFAIPDGGGIFFRDGSLTVMNSLINANSAGGRGGGISLLGSTATNRTVNLINTVISNNKLNFNPNGVSTAGIDVLIFNSSLGSLTLNILRCTVSDNDSGTGAGAGGLTNSTTGADSLINITDSTFSGNKGSVGGIDNRTNFSGNATVTLRGSTLRNNSATGDGGGIFNFVSSAAATGSAVINATNSTVSGNSSERFGGGIANLSTRATVNLNYCTVASNTASVQAGGLYQGSGQINLKNSIVADNTASVGRDIFGTITSQNYNHIENITGGVFFADAANNIEDETGFMALPNDVTGIDPMLGPLADNGGATFTHLPALASPVINTIPNGVGDCGTTVLTSQNGVTRPQQAGCEKGSTERTLPPLATASVRGRLLTPFGRGLQNAFVILTNPSTGEKRTVRTTSFGYFNFQNLPTGVFYILNATGKRYRFIGQSFTLNESIDGLVLTGQ